MAKEPTIEDLRIGEGKTPAHRDAVRIRLSIQLSKGDVVLDNETVAFQIGARSVVAGLEKGIEGMKAGGRRKISFGPHLGYGAAGTGAIPANAKLICYVDLLEVFEEGDPAGPVGIRRMIRRSK